jgi:hypothetical protein
MSRFRRAKWESRLITSEIILFNMKPSKVEVPRRLTRKPRSLRTPFIIVLGMAVLMLSATRWATMAKWAAALHSNRRELSSREVRQSSADARRRTVPAPDTDIGGADHSNVSPG